MVRLFPVVVDGIGVTGIEIELPRTHLAVVAGDRGYLMCGALDVALLDGRLAQRRILAGRAVGVRTVAELLEAPLESVTREAQAAGLRPGMLGREAVRYLVSSAALTPASGSSAAAPGEAPPDQEARRALKAGR
ncbi:MAG: DUF1805 domain-containing protein [Bacillota bacterium]|nr:DUF1805 domain-containing protein [Bacillota bacterium]